MLSRYERKSLQTDRVILVPGPEREIEAVRQTYDLFVTKGNREREIMELLNGRGIPGEHGRPWTRATVHQVSINPKCKRLQSTLLQRINKPSPPEGLRSWRAQGVPRPPRFARSALVAGQRKDRTPDACRNCPWRKTPNPGTVRRRRGSLYDKSVRLRRGDSRGFSAVSSLWRKREWIRRRNGGGSSQWRTALCD